MKAGARSEWSERSPGYVAGQADAEAAEPAWLSWAGARAALQLSLGLPPERVEQHCLRLAANFRDGARAAGAVPVGDGTSHIAAVRVTDSRSLLARLQSSGIRAAALGDRLRLGFHYFNNDSDVEAILRALRESL
jgi:selenocysteine lyase/cysteine desulfurase